MNRAVIAIVAAVLAVPALGQTTDFQQVFANKEVPASLKLNQLDGTWQHVVIRSSESQKGGLGDMLGQLMQLGAMSEFGKDKGGAKPSDQMAGMAVMSMLGGLFGGSDEPVYYTQGKTVTVAGETFLIAYTIEKKTPDIMSLMGASEKSGKEPDMAALASMGKVTGDSALTLNLMNVRSIGTMAGIRAFKLETEIAEASKGNGLLDMLATQRETVPTEAPTKPAKVTAPQKKGSK